jgi:hypothetical protein
MTDHPQEERQSASPQPAEPSAASRTDGPSPRTVPIPPPGPPRRPAGIEKRRPGGRERPYRALRVLAKLYALLAPLVLIGLVLVGLAGLMRTAPLAERIGSALGAVMMAGLYYLLMKSISDAIYILFDIAGNTRRTRELAEMRESPPG